MSHTIEESLNNDENIFSKLRKYLDRLVFKYTPLHDETKMQPKQVRLDFLDGYRGLLALNIVWAHAKDDYKCIVLDIIGNWAQKFAITGFFLLSSFLLTHRLIKDLQKPTNLKLLSILQYFIRRFFRIYVVYILFAIVAKYGPSFVAGFTYGNYNGSLANMLSLGQTGLNHLWTIPPEIKFYFVIPLICLSFVCLGNFSFLFLASCLAWTAYDQCFNYFNLRDEDVFSYSKHSHLLRNHFAVFLVGSEVAMALYLAERCELCMKWIRGNKVKLILNVTSIAIGVFGLVFHTENLNLLIDYK